METNHEYKGFLGCFPDIIGAHKVCEGPLLVRVGQWEDLHGEEQMLFQQHKQGFLNIVRHEKESAV